MRALLFVVATLAVLAAACSGDSGDGPAADSSASTEAPVGTTAEAPPEASALQQEIAATLEGFFEAFFNDNPAELVTYWSQDCAQADIDLINENLVLFADAIGGAAELSIDAAALVIEELGDDRVRVPGMGTYNIIVGSRPFPDPDAEGEAEDIVLVLQEGAWRVTGCDQFAANLQLGD